MALSIIFWAEVYNILDKWEPQLTERFRYFVILEHSVPTVLLIIDLFSGAIIFHASHSLILGIFLIAYYATNYLLAKFGDTIVYGPLDLTWKDSKSLILVSIHFVLTMFMYYLLFLVSQCRHHRIAKRVSKRRLTMKEQMGDQAKARKNSLS